MLDWISENAGLMNLLFSGVVMISTVVYAWLTASLVRETKRMRRVQTEPSLAIYLERDEHVIGALHLVVRNVGSGPAHRIRFTVTDVVLTDWAADAVGRLSFLNDGLRFLAPGASMRSLAGAVFQQDAKDFTFTVHVTYEDTAGVEFTDVFKLDFAAFYGITSIGEPPLKALAKEVAEIRKVLQRQAG